jgi:hypothetical protein
MYRIFHPSFPLLFWLSLPFLIVYTSLVFAAEKSEPSIVVDFVAGTVGGINIRGEIDDLKHSIGAHRIKKSTEYLEGEPSDVYIISFGNHKIFKHWNAFSYNDPIFRTKEGLGVSSKVKDFNRTYGQGRISEEEGFAIYYKVEDSQVSVMTKYINGKEQAIDLYANSVVNDVWVW